LTCKITIPAVKISTGSTAPLFPLLPDHDSMMIPDTCSSATTNASIMKIAPIDSALFLRPKDETDMETIPMPVTNLADADENEEEFGEFLLDAVDWL